MRRLRGEGGGRDLVVLAPVVGTDTSVFGRRFAGQPHIREPARPAETRGSETRRCRVPPRGVKKGTKRARQYEHVKESQLERGVPEPEAEEIAARTVQKERARAGESRARSRTSVEDISSGRRGGLRSGTARPKGRTYEQLYNEARSLDIRGRSKMKKAELQRAVDRKTGRKAG
jgi:hypothetical protein